MTRTGSMLALLLVFFAVVSAPCGSHGSVVSSSEDNAKKLYIVYMGAKHHEDPDVVESLHHDTLSSVLGSKEEALGSIVYSYKHGFSGFAAMITESQAKKLSGMRGVESVKLSQTVRMSTTRSWDFLGLTSEGSSQLLRKAKMGDGVIIGVIDSGIWPESRSFDDSGYGPVPARWKGKCQTGVEFNATHCNRKIIGARWYSAGVPETFLKGDYLSPRDLSGHGTHVAAAAAGSYVENVSVGGLAAGRARGGAPLARLAIYKVLWGIQVNTTDALVIAAIDDAIHDGVDVLSLSLAANEEAWGFPSLHAVLKGITVVYAAGNYGPFSQTVVNLSPWVLTVAASTMDRSLGELLSPAVALPLVVFSGFNLEGRAARMQSSANGSDNQRTSQQAQQQHQQAPLAPSPAQWPAAMPYPGAAMIMPNQMMAAAGLAPPPPYAPHYIPFHQVPPLLPQYQQHQPQQPGSADENRTLWVGDLLFWMDENYLQHCFGHTGEVALVKVIRNKQTGHSEGYGFVEFFSRMAAEKVLQAYSGMIMPNTDQLFRINWASFSMGDKRSDNGSDHSIFVGDLAPDVTDTLLQETFSTKYSSVKGAKVVIDPNTGRSKGYGFVRFGDEGEKSRAMTEMNGAFCSSRAMRIGAATPRKSSGSSSNGSQGLSMDGDPTNTTVFVGGLDPNVSEDVLRQSFAECGDIASIKIPAGKQCGFVQFVQRTSAEDALQKLNGTTIGKQVVRLSWGRNPANRQMRTEAQSQWNNVYFGGQVYGGYAYASPHDPGMYAAAYGAYPPLYGSQQQVS